MDSSFVKISENQGVDVKESGFNATLSYESVLNVFYKRLHIKPNQCQLIRALLIASNGEKHFEVSYLELADILFDKNSATNITLKKRVSDWLDVLLAWQQKNRLELVRVLEKGSRKETTNGRIEYHKTKYELVVLDEFINLFHSSSEKDLNENLEKFISLCKEKFQPVGDKKKYHPRHQVKKNKRDILTKFKRIFELMVEIDESPIDYCMSVLSESRQMIGKMADKWTEQRNRDQIISEFESLINNDESLTDEKDSGLEF